MDHEKHIGYEIHTLDRMIGRHLDIRIEELNLSKMQSWIIRYLYERPNEAVFQKDLEAFFHIARSTATGILQGMEKQGYLTRCSVENDARLKRLVLTEKGIGMQMAVFRILDDTNTNLRRNISQEDLDTFYRVFEQIKENLGNTACLPVCQDKEN